jgi:hypothetical protein
LSTSSSMWSPRSSTFSAARDKHAQRCVNWRRILSCSPISHRGQVRCELPSASTQNQVNLISQNRKKRPHASI